MTKAQGILLKLIRISLGNEEDLSFPATSADDWKKAVEISYLHAISSICVDGFQKCLEPGSEISRMFSSRDMDETKYEWLGSLLSDEDQWDIQWAAACRMSEIFHKAGLKTYIMKGFSIAEMYPEPKHRYFCDLDCYLIDGKGNSASEQGNKLIERRGVRIDRSYYKNSTFSFMGLMVENHSYFTPVRGARGKKAYERYLISILEDGAVPLKDTFMMVPSPLFILLFTTSHAMVHFMIEDGLMLRHLCDWGVIMRHYSSSQPELWQTYVEKCKEFGLFKFASSFARCAAEVTGIEIPFDCPENSLADKRMLDSIVNLSKRRISAPKWLRRIRNVCDILRSRWKFKLYSETSMSSSLLELVSSFFFERNPQFEDV